jgi:hypothetical protein
MVVNQVLNEIINLKHPEMKNYATLFFRKKSSRTGKQGFYLFLFLLSISLLYRIPTFGQAGSLDESFNPGSGANGEITIMAMQPDGKIYELWGFTGHHTCINNSQSRISL